MHSVRLLTSPGNPGRTDLCALAHPSGSGVVQPVQRQVRPLAGRRIVTGHCMTRTPAGDPERPFLWLSGKRPLPGATAAPRDEHGLY